MTSPIRVPDVEANLKRSITLPQALGVSFHQIVGGGVIALMGVAIALTGGGAPLAFAMAAGMVIIYSLPVAVLGSAMPVTGGRYSYAARLISPSLGFTTMWFSVLVTIQLSLMALAGADYLHSLVPSVPARPLALGLITVFFLANLAGAAFSNRLGIVLAFVMLAAFLLYGFAGLPQVEWGTIGDVAPQGVGNLLTAAALLTFAVTGSTYVAELGREMKRPGRDIPLSMIGGIVLSAVLYVFLAIPSVGVLPVPDVAGKPMSVVADHILSPGVFAFFILGGALASVVGHMNSLLLTATKPVLAAIGDGWLPERLGAVNQRYGTPHWLLFGLYLIGAVPVLTGFSVAAIAGMVSVAATPMLAIMIISSCRLRSRYPDLYAAAPFRMPWRLHVATVALGTAVLAVQAYLLVDKLTGPAVVALVSWLLLGIAVWSARRGHAAAVVRARAAGGAGDAPAEQPSAERTAG
ncbi:APC family permease [Streptomyces sp. B-S-A8]|uniref:APC family permease n=1 Tax=Streptomyces solicavernae TaxID=3043614 RepID=A0ABT6RWQ1_9ACTN|nr:APC family permease [Streptomyces sp. B-S-A8]MDI3388091.1 APC family permease [Streptomyces sp. B-S-A8]